MNSLKFLAASIAFLLSGIAISEPKQLIEERLVSLKGVSVSEAKTLASGYAVEVILGQKVEAIRGTELELALREISGKGELTQGDEIQVFLRHQGAANALCELLVKENLIGVSKEGTAYSCIQNQTAEAQLPKQVALAQISSRQLIESRQDGLSLDVVPGTANLVRLAQGNQIASEIFVLAVYQGGLFLVSRAGDYQIITLDAPRGAGLFERRG